MSPETGRPRISLLLAGGGITGAMYEFGALQALDHFFAGTYSVNKFDIYVGTSAGAIVAALMANGVSPGEVGRSIILQCIRARYSPMMPSAKSWAPEKIAITEARNGKPGTPVPPNR